MARQTARRQSGRKAAPKRKATTKAKAAPKRKTAGKSAAKPRAKSTAKAQSKRKPAQRKATSKSKTGGRPTARDELKRKTAAKAASPRTRTKGAAPRKPPPARKLYRAPVREPEPEIEPEFELEPEDELEPEEATFATPIVGATLGSMVIVVVVAILNTGLGRDLERHLDAPARTLIAAPVIILAVVVVVASLVALSPAYRRDSLRLAEIAGWLIPSWLVMVGMGIAAVAWALSHS
jgi:hypothetical protein